MPRLARPRLTAAATPADDTAAPGWIQRGEPLMALGGMRALARTRLAPGPFCTMLLGDLGADVIVVEEAPGAGRRFDVGLGERAQAFNALGRNKRSIGLNLKDEAARQVFYRLGGEAGAGGGGGAARGV